VTKLALSLNKYTIVSATSTGCAILPNAVVEKSSAEADPSPVVMACLISGVSVPPLSVPVKSKQHTTKWDRSIGKGGQLTAQYN
jgi:hypothetical protein